VSEHREHSAQTGIALGGTLAALGGVLLGLQVDQNGALSGTGLTTLAIGALLALGTTVARVKTLGGLPRDTLGLFAAAASFLASAFVFAGVLAPGGPWMFFEVFLIVALVVLRKPPGESARWIGNGTLGLLATMLLFRLWVSWQGSENRWQVMSVDIPVISWFKFAFLEPFQSIALGSFTPHELGFPPAGLGFAPTAALWSIGFALALAGLVIVQTSAREHENDRIHALIHTLPTPFARVIERLLPEEEWHALGLHGLPERRLAKKIEALVGERVAKQKELASALDATKLLAQTNPGGFTGEIFEAIVDAKPAKESR
jgi:hypothetical protein